MTTRDALIEKLCCLLPDLKHELVELILNVGRGDDDSDSITLDAIERTAMLVMKGRANGLQIAQSGEWQDIASAPKDGTDVLVYRPGGKENDYMPKVGVDYMRKFTGRGLLWANSNPDTQPTHWRELPSPPKAATGEQT